MIGKGSYVRSCDNSGAKIVKCIHIYKGKNKLVQLGDILLVVVKTFRTKKKVKKGDIRKAVLVRKKQNSIRTNGLVLKFRRNLVILIDKNHNMLGNRFKGPVPLELRFKKFMKIVSIAPFVV